MAGITLTAGASKLWPPVVGDCRSDEKVGKQHQCQSADDCHVLVPFGTVP